MKRQNIPPVKTFIHMKIHSSTCLSSRYAKKNYPLRRGNYPQPRFSIGQWNSMKTKTLWIETSSKRIWVEFTWLGGWGRGVPKNCSHPKSWTLKIWFMINAILRKFMRKFNISLEKDSLKDQLVIVWPLGKYISRYYQHWH